MPDSFGRTRGGAASHRKSEDKQEASQLNRFSRVPGAATTDFPWPKIRRLNDSWRLNLSTIASLATAMDGQRLQASG